MTSAIAKALSILVCLVILVKSTNALSCYPCDPVVDCPRGNLTESDCPFGVVKGVCGCCDTCAKGPGEDCGGMWGEYGTCGLDLTCTRNAIPGSLSNYFYRPGLCT